MNIGLYRNKSVGLLITGTMLIALGILLFASTPLVAQEADEYMGVRDCNDCHVETARNHSLSAHANSLIEVTEENELILGDFSVESPLLVLQLPGEDEVRAITREDIAYAVGYGRNKQYYLIEIEPDMYRVLPFAWDVETATWEAVSLADDWSDVAYSWNQTCVDCHATGYDSASGEWVDDGVQCESCHGAGGEHVELADDAGREIDDDELQEIVSAINTTPSEGTCETCHNTAQFDGIHQPLVSLMNGEMIVEGVSSSATEHVTMPDGPDCISCHFKTEVNEDGEIVTLHDMDVSIIEHSETCVDCHSELTISYAQRFLIGQQEDTEQRLALIHTRLDDGEALPSWVLDSVQILDADSSGGIHNMPYTEALLHSAELYLGLVEPSNLFTAPVASDPQECIECHAEEHAEWAGSTHALATTNDHFQELYAQNGQPAYCLRCHASGFDANTNTVLFEGVVCSSCHIIEGEHPPAPATMGTNVTTCATCHSGGHASAYEEWLASEHQVVGVDCVDCHNAHNNEMLLGDVNATCGDCHADAMNDEVHMGEDLVCIDCHMTPRETVTDPTMLTRTGHSMDISPGVCADCHGTTHSLTVALVDTTQQASEIEALHEDVLMWQMTAEENLNSGLLGGAIGVLLVLGLVYLVLRIGRSS